MNARTQQEVDFLNAIPGTWIDWIATGSKVGERCEAGLVAIDVFLTRGFDYLDAVELAYDVVHETEDDDGIVPAAQMLTEERIASVLC